MTVCIFGSLQHTKELAKKAGVGTFRITIPLQLQETIMFDTLKKRYVNSVIYLLLASFVWLFVNQAMNSHSHLLMGGQVITHAHPYTPDKNSHSPFQSHKHLPSVAFFLDLITSLNVDSFESLLVVLFLLFTIASVPLLKLELVCQKYFSSGDSRAPPVRYCNYLA